MNYRLPQRATTSCSSTGCTTFASWLDATRADALAGWSLGPGSASCPEHAVHTAAIRVVGA